MDVHCDGRRDPAAFGVSVPRRNGAEVQALRNGAETEIPLIDLEIDSSHPNAQFVEDYWYWFWNWQFDPRI